MNKADFNIKLRKLFPDDKYRLAELANNKKISINMRDAFPHPYTLEDAEKFITASNGKDPQEVFAIEYNGEYVGNIGLHKANDVYRKSAEIGYFLGEPFWNKGIMTKVVELICEYGFRELDIVRIHTGVFEYNKASRRVLTKCGFVKEGVFKSALYRNGKIYDEIRFARIKSSS